MDASRFYFRFSRWHIPLILLVLLLGLFAWASTWHYMPKVTPKLMGVKPTLEIENNAWLGYELKPFQIKFKEGDKTRFALESKTTREVKARGKTNIPLTPVLGTLDSLSLSEIKMETEITASKWWMKQEINIIEEKPLETLVDGIKNQILETATEVMGRVL